MKRLKAALGIGTIWGLASGAAGALVGSLTQLPTGSVLSSGLFFGATTGATAFVLGVGFSGMLSLMERRRTLAELTARRAARWGLVAGAGLASVAAVSVAIRTGAFTLAGSGLGIPVGAQVLAIAVGAASYGAVTAGLAAATVSLAKRAPSELRPSSDELVRELLGAGEPKGLGGPSGGDGGG